METDDFTYYPPKPEIDDKNTASMVKTIISLALFVGLFMLLSIPINYIFLVVLVLFIHEMGHLIAMKSYGYEDVGMFFIPFVGAVVTGRKEEMSQWQRIIIILAGPMPGILIGVLLIVGVQVGGWNEMLLFYGTVFIALNVLNLVPLDPLDGGKLFEQLFFTFNETAKLIFTILSALLMVGVGLYFSYYILMVFGVFMLTRVQTQFKLLKLRKRINHLDIPLDVSYSKLSDEHYWRIRKEYIQVAKLENMVVAESKDYDENENVLAPAIRNLLRTPVDKDVSAIGKFLFVVLWLGAVVGSVYAVIPILNKLQPFLY